jgi:hypothetical protein
MPLAIPDSYDAPVILMIEVICTYQRTSKETSLAALYFDDLVYSCSEPLTIQGETSAGRGLSGNNSLLRPMKDRTFGCRSCRHTSASRQSL